MRRVSGLVAVAAALAVGLGTPAAALTGREVIDQAQEKHNFSTWKDRTITATMKTFDDGSLVRTREVDITEQTDPEGEHRTFLHFTGPADVQGTRFLHLSPRGERDQQWLYAPLTRRTRRIADSQRDENFFGSDLSYRDLELLVRIQQWGDAEATATLVSEEEIDGKPSHLVELVPKDNPEFPYTRYRLWFGTDDLRLWQLDIYDEDDAVVKRVRPRKYQRIGKYETAMEADVANVQAKTNTVFEMDQVRYDVDVSERTFTVGNLER